MIKRLFWSTGMTIPLIIEEWSLNRNSVVDTTSSTSASKVIQMLNNIISVELGSKNVSFYLFNS